MENSEVQFEVQTKVYSLTMARELDERAKLTASVVGFTEYINGMLSIDVNAEGNVIGKLYAYDEDIYSDEPITNRLVFLTYKDNNLADSYVGELIVEFIKKPEV
jgi:hypothetical protein